MPSGTSRRRVRCERWPRAPAHGRSRGPASTSLSITTHPRIFRTPTPIGAARDQVDAWLQSPTLVTLAEDGAHWHTLRGLVEQARIDGPRVHDARVAALCLRHGVRELWTADRDFSLFPALRVRNPLVG